MYGGKVGDNDIGKVVEFLKQQRRDQDVEITNKVN